MICSSARREFIYSKYWEKKYCKYHQAFGDADVLGKVNFVRKFVGEKTLNREKNARESTRVSVSR